MTEQRWPPRLWATKEQIQVLVEADCLSYRAHPTEECWLPLVEHEAKVEVLKRALEFYAKPGVWECVYGNIPGIPAQMDGGCIAREALAELERSP